MTTTPSTSLYPIHFEAQNIPRIWGADHLGAPRNGVPIGERWLLSPLPSKETLVANGELAGMTPSQLVVRYGASLLGKKGSWADLPLVKWIDSAHPPFRYTPTTSWHASSESPTARAKCGTS